MTEERTKRALYDGQKYAVVLLMRDSGDIIPYGFNGRPFAENVGEHTRVTAENLCDVLVMESLTPDDPADYDSIVRSLRWHYARRVARPNNSDRLRKIIMED